MKPAHIFAFFVISLALGFAVFAFMGAVPQYLTIKDARNSTTPVQVKGKILHDTVNYDNGMGALRFQIEDDNKERIQVVYSGREAGRFRHRARNRRNGNGAESQPTARNTWTPRA